MPSNINLVEEKTTLLQNKLEKIAAELTSGGDFQTEEQIISEIVRVLESFYRDLTEPIFVPETIAAGDTPDSSLYNKIWNDILKDLELIFTELENLEDVTVANFNFVSTESGRLLARLKNVSSQLGDFILYSSNPTKDAFYFKDSFNDLSRVEADTSLINAAPCEIDQDQGIVTLPVNKEKDSVIKVTADPIINRGSNGVVGNNQQLRVAFNGDPKSVLDNNPDTWFEYEKVVRQEEDLREPLVLDMTINLGTEQIINYVRINPNNFGTRTVIQIDRIETSLDGRVFTNIKDDIPIGDFLTKDEDNVFVLAPSTSKYAGQGIYSFTPRKAKFVHFVFKQNEPFIIQTNQGQRLRYAIGIRDIDIRAFQYLPEGEFVSSEYSFTTNENIRKVALDANQNPIEESLLGKIQYFVSPDNGQTWTELRPKSFSGFANVESEVLEIVDFNGSEEKSVQTATPVAGLRLKGKLSRDDNAFEEGASTLRKEIKSRSEIHKVPDASPFEITLEQPPVEGSIIMVDPMYGSRGLREFQYIIGQASAAGRQNQTFYLPFTKFKRVYKKTSSGTNPVIYSTPLAPASEWLHIFVGGEEWQMATQPLTSYTANYSTAPTYRLFTFNPNNGALLFGNGYYTMQPPAVSAVSMYLDAERLYPSEVADEHTAKLEYTTSNDKDAFALKRYDAAEDHTEILPKKASIIHLEFDNITDLGNISTILSGLGFTSKVTFVDGVTELTTATRWSIDTDEGIIYLGGETAADTEASIHYKHQVANTLTNDDWDWGNVQSLRDSIQIKESAWKTIEADELTLPATSNRKVLDLAHFALVKNSVKFTLEDTTGTAIDDSVNPFLREVPFINGLTEFGASVIRVQEKVPALTPAGATNLASFNLVQKISPSSIYTVVFSAGGIFTGEDILLNSVGDWYIDRDSTSATYRKVTVRLSSSSAKTLAQTGTVTYYYLKPNATTSGLYSIDYVKGRVYLQRPLLGGTWSLVANYQYTDYRAEYRIARKLPTTSFEVNRTDRKVKIKDTEVLYRGVVPREKSGEQQAFYQVTYDYVSETREKIADLKDFFTPVLKDYVLKVITKGQLI